MSDGQRSGRSTGKVSCKGIYIAQVRKDHKCAMSAEMAVYGYVTVYVSLAIYITNCQDS